MERHRTKRVRFRLIPLCLLALSVACGHLRPHSSRLPVALAAVPNKERSAPRAFRGRGALVCLAEEMRTLFEAEVPPVHEHLRGFRLDGKIPPGTLRYCTIVRTAQSEALFVDERFSKHTLILSGRIFPETALLEVSGWQWERGGRIYEVYYWCDVCAIRGFDPGPCACCQAPVVLREAEVRGAKNG